MASLSMIDTMGFGIRNMTLSQRAAIFRLKHYGSASRDELVTLILDKLSDALDEKQKQNKFRNLLNAMSTRDKTIEKSGDLHKGRWILKREPSIFI
jgi:hypothetical protein